MKIISLKNRDLKELKDILEEPKKQIKLKHQNISRVWEYF